MTPRSIDADAHIMEGPDAWKYVSEGLRAKILGENAARFYRLVSTSTPREV